MNGLDPHDKLAGNPPCPPVIMITAHDDAATRERIQKWDVFGVDTEILTRRGEPAEPAVFSPDGALIATGHGDGTVGVWDAATRRERYLLVGHATKRGEQTTGTPGPNPLPSSSHTRNSRSVTFLSF